MATVDEWLAGVTQDGQQLDPVRVARMRERHLPVRPVSVAPNPQRVLTTAELAASFATVTADTLRRKLTTGVAYLPDEAIEARLAICRTCDQFDGAACKLCGCGCQREATWLNKLAHHSSHCPANPPKWGPIP